MEFDMNILSEALLHAQYGGRDTPCLADFPASVTREAVENVYLPFLANQEAEMQRSLVLGDVAVVGYDRSPAVTLAGDAIAAGLLLSDVLSLESFYSPFVMNDVS